MTTPSTDFLTPIANGFAELLALANTGVTWHSDGDYQPPDPWPIRIGFALPDAAACITITPYVLAEHPVYTDTTVGVQFRYRSPGADIRGLWGIRDWVRAYLRGRFPLRLPTGPQVTALTFTSGASMGQNDQRLWEWADSWTARVGVVHPVAG